jgi:hypothetical protein
MEGSWIHDKDAPSCAQCRYEFTIFFRRHHCRNCGRVFCGDCSSRTLEIDKKSVRVCDGCFRHVTQNARQTKRTNSPSAQRLLYNTQTVCSACAVVDRKGFQPISASVVEQGGRILMLRACARHGSSTVVVCSDAAFYHRINSFTGRFHTSFSTSNVYPAINLFNANLRPPKASATPPAISSPTGSTSATSTSSTSSTTSTTSTSTTTTSTTTSTSTTTNPHNDAAGEFTQSTDSQCQAPHQPPDAEEGTIRGGDEQRRLLLKLQAEKRQRQRLERARTQQAIKTMLTILIVRLVLLIITKIRIRIRIRIRIVILPKIIGQTRRAQTPERA